MILPVILYFLIQNLALFSDISATRGVRLYPNEEPETDQTHSCYRNLAIDRAYYYLNRIGLSNEQMRVDPSLTNDIRDSSGNLGPISFKFNSSEITRMFSVVKWFIPLEERTSLHVYDNPEDQKLSAGPQVNQNQCGLHLDYMNLLIEKHLQNIQNSTDYSIFTLMHTFEAPGLSLAVGSTVFPGDYLSCLEHKLSIVKEELATLNSTAADEYFRYVNSSKNSTDSRIGLRPSIMNVAKYFATFLGFPLEGDQAPVDEYSDRIHLLPMRYCLAGIRWPSWPNSSFYKRNTVYRMATCLPETCDSSSLLKHGDKIKRLTDFVMLKYLSGYYIDQLYCLPDEKSPYRNPFNYLNTTLFVMFATIWCILLIAATLVQYILLKQCDRNNQATGISQNFRSRWWYYLRSWCITKNFKDFIFVKRAQPTDQIPTNNNNSDENDMNEMTNKSANVCQTVLKPRRNFVNLEPLEGFKVISSLSVITSHACMVAFGFTWNSATGHQIMTKTWLASLYTLCPAVVDNFFVMTGILTVRILLLKHKKSLTSFKFWVSFFIYRYVRIVPLYALIHWFLQSSFRFLGSGPFWDYGTSSTAISRMCQNESIWNILLPRANFISPGTHCNGVGWYLANDIQISLVTPFVVLLYMKAGQTIGHVAIVTTVVAAMANHIAYYLNYDPTDRGIFEISLMSLTRVTDDVAVGYVYPQYRCVAYLIGLAVGHILVDYELGKIRRLPKKFVSYGKIYLISFYYALLVAPFTATLLPLSNKDVIRPLAALTEGLLHGLTSVGAAIFVLLLCTGHLPYISKAFSMDFLKPLGNVSLSTLLVHIPLIFYHSQTQRSLPELSVYFFITKSIIWCLEALLLSIVVHIMIEVPLRKFLIKVVANLLTDSNEIVQKSIEIRQDSNKTKRN